MAEKWHNELAGDYKALSAEDHLGENISPRDITHKMVCNRLLKAYIQSGELPLPLGQMIFLHLRLLLRTHVVTDQSCIVPFFSSCHKLAFVELAIISIKASCNNNPF